jgi:hypothetical protein
MRASILLALKAAFLPLPVRHRGRACGFPDSFFLQAIFLFKEKAFRILSKIENRP